VQTSRMSTQDQTEDTPPDDDEEAVDQPEDATPTAEAESEDARIDGITERIEKARTQAEEAGVLVDEDEETFVESGTTEEDDDQTIAPPG
jgi:hypothetical protein